MIFASRHMLENIGIDSDANFHMKLDKIKDINYHKALLCLRRHLHVIECVLTKKIYIFYPRFLLYILKKISVQQIIATLYVYRYFHIARNRVQHDAIADSRN